MNEVSEIIEEFRKERNCYEVLLIGAEKEINKIDLRNFPKGVEIQKVQDTIMGEHKDQVFLLDTSSFCKIQPVMFDPTKEY